MKLVYKDHPGDLHNVLIIDRWSLYAGSITWKVYPGDLYNVVFRVRWSLYIQVVFGPGLTVYKDYITHYEIYPHMAI